MAMSATGESLTSLVPTSEPEFNTAEPESEYSPGTEQSVSEPEVRPTSEPFPEFGKSESAQDQGWPEPEPEWSSSILEWNLAWPIHVYLIGSVFILISVVALLFLLKSLFVLKPRVKGKLTFSLLTMTELFALLRGIVLLMDPYGTNENIHWLVFRVLSSVCLPFLMSSFSIVLLVLIDTTKMSFGPPIFQKLSTILLITFSYMVLVIASDLIVFFNSEAKAMLILCQCVFILYGSILAVGYTFVGMKIRKNCSALSGGYAAISSLVRISFSSAVVSAMITLTYIYSAAFVFNMYTNTMYVHPWKWWSLQTLIRMEEIAVCILVLIIATRNVRKHLSLSSRFKVSGTKKVAPVFVQPTCHTTTIRLESTGTNDEGSFS